MADIDVSRAGLALAVADFQRSVSFYTETLGFTTDVLFDEPAYAVLSKAGMRLSLAAQGHPAPDAPTFVMQAPTERPNTQAVLILEVADCKATYDKLKSEGVTFLADLYSPSWGGHRFFVYDPDGYLVEIEELA